MEQDEMKNEDPGPNLKFQLPVGILFKKLSFLKHLQVIFMFILLLIV